MSKYSEELRNLKQKPWRRPSGIVMAFEEPHSANEVIIAGPLRYRITQQLTRAEFMVQLRENFRHAEAVSAVATVVGSKIETEGTVDQAEPGPEFTHFYAAECI